MSSLRQGRRDSNGGEQPKTEGRRCSQVLDCTQTNQIQLASARMRFQKPKWARKLSMAVNGQKDRKGGWGVVQWQRNQKRVGGLRVTLQSQSQLPLQLQLQLPLPVPLRVINKVLSVESLLWKRCILCGAFVVHLAVILPGSNSPWPCHVILHYNLLSVRPRIFLVALLPTLCGLHLQLVFVRLCFDFASSSSSLFKIFLLLLVKFAFCLIYAKICGYCNVDQAPFVGDVCINLPKTGCDPIAFWDCYSNVSDCNVCQDKHVAVAWPHR